MSLPARRSIRTPRTAGLLVVLMCLLLVGAIRSVTPDGRPDEYRVLPDEHGVVRTDEVTAELVSVESAASIRHADESRDVQFVASKGAVMVLARFRLTAHGSPFVASTQLRTTDGYAYGALSLPGFPQPNFHVGFTVTTTFIYEVPIDKVAGVIGIHGPRGDGVQPVHPLITFPLREGLSTRPGEVRVPAVEMEPVR